MNDGEVTHVSAKSTWPTFVCAFAGGVVVALLISAMVGYYFEANRKVYAGADFPTAWAGREVLGSSYGAALSVEEFSRNIELSRMKYDYAVWCEERGIKPRPDAELVLPPALGESPTIPSYEDVGFSKTQAELIRNVGHNTPNDTRRLQLMEAQRREGYPDTPHVMQWEWDGVSASVVWGWPADTAYHLAMINGLEDVQLVSRASAASTALNGMWPAGGFQSGLIELLTEHFESGDKALGTVDGFEVTVESDSEGTCSVRIDARNPH